MKWDIYYQTRPKTQKLEMVTLMSATRFFFSRPNATERLWRSRSRKKRLFFSVPAARKKKRLQRSRLQCAYVAQNVTDRDVTTLSLMWSHIIFFLFWRPRRADKVPAALHLAVRLRSTKRRRRRRNGVVAYATPSRVPTRETEPHIRVYTIFSIMCTFGYFFKVGIIFIKKGICYKYLLHDHVFLFFLT